MRVWTRLAQSRRTPEAPSTVVRTRASTRAEAPSAAISTRVTSVVSRDRDLARAFAVSFRASVRLLVP